MNIAIRVDASDKIGIGHFIRCETLANRLRENGHKIKFLYRVLPDALIKRLAKNNIEYCCVKNAAENSPTDELAHADWLEVSQQADVSACRAVLEDNSWDWLIVDHYALDHRWETQMLDVVDNIMVIDDLSDRAHNCQLLLDQNYTHAASKTYQSLTPEKCEILLGPKYALLMPEYAQLHESVQPRERVKNIMISFGGSDKYNMTGQTIDALLSMDHTQFEINLISPLYSPWLNEIKRKISESRNFIMHDHLPSLAPLLSRCDLAFGAMGATSWERLCLGVPTIAVTLAENQVPPAKALHEDKLVHWLGFAPEVTQESIVQSLHSLLEPNMLNSTSRRCLSICDGKGVERVIHYLSLIED